MKRLIVCCDGTWNQLASSCPTNVVKIAQAIQPIASDRTPQIVFYEQGIGTQWYDKVPGGAFGWGIDQNIQEAYRFLSLNYVPGDEIYLFGFSRGAYTVRSLAGMIYCSGLLSRPHIAKAPRAYQIYRDRTIKPSNPVAEEFRQQYGDRVPITLLGCWDTVGALGVPDLIPYLPINDWLVSKYRFHDTQLSSKILHALHAIAIDERRKVFDVAPMQKSPKAPTQVVKQVWFPGTHGCVGGGTKAYEGLSNGALGWMMHEINQFGLKLEFDPDRIEGGLRLNPAIDFNNDPGFYRLSGVIRRQINYDLDELDESVKQRWRDRSDYRPKNLVAFSQALDAFSQTIA